MRLVAVTIVVALISIIAAEDSTDNLNVKLNSIETKPSVRLDPYIRKALLKALSELEEHENLTTGAGDETSTIDSEILRTGEDDNTEQAKEGIQIHSFVVNGQSAFDNNTNATPMLIDDKISILSTTAGNVENQVTATLPTQTPFNEVFQSKESTINVQQVRSIQSTLSTKLNVVGEKGTTLKPAPTTTTSTTTTTTTPKPTHNIDGENIEEVNKQDVQVFQAPLVAAFTVHQDAQGLPKKVVPIYQQTNVQNQAKTASTSTLPTNIVAPQQTANVQTIPSQSFSPDKAPQNDFINRQLALQIQLEEKQRLLEEQLRFLQLQQKQQEELLRKQQFFLQQKEGQRQHQSLFEQEQLKRQQFLAQQQLPSNQPVNSFQNQKTIQQNQIFSNNNVRPQTPQVFIQQSIPLDQSNSLTNQQQLPNREAVDFLLHLRSQQSEQFPLQDNHLPQGISSFLQPNSIQSFQQLPNFNQKQGNRVFRQESGVGNFGVNQNYNRFNSNGPIFSNRFFLYRPNQFTQEAELNQLLVQNGLNARSHEDLNIVSKVLSLNHGIPINNNVSNRLSFDSRRHVRLS